MTGRGRDTIGKKAINKNHLQKAGCGTQGKPTISKNRSKVMPPGSLAIANNRMRQQKAPSAAQKPPTAIQKVPSAVQKAQSVQAATPVQEPPSQAATLVQAPPSQVAAPVQTPPLIQTTTPDASRFIPTPGFTLAHQFAQGPLEDTTHDMETDPHHQEDEQDHEEGDIEEDGEEDNHEKDASGKFILRPICDAFTPAKPAAEAIRRVIEQTFPDNITCYSDIIEDDAKDIWFQRFGMLVSWAPHHAQEIKTIFHQRCGKRLSDILTKARNKKEKPAWMHKEGWTYLTNKWKEEEFKKRSERNKINQASSKGGALHTTGRKAHHDIALDMSSKLGRPVDPDELFVVTHKKKNGNWVDRRSEITHNEYHQKLAQMTQTNGGATGDTQKIDGSQKMQIWKDAAGGKSRGRCYGTGQLDANLRNGVTHLTYEAEAPHTRAENQIIEAARAEAAAARADANAARADAEAAKADAAAAKATTRSFEIKFEELYKRMMTLETASCSGQSRQSSHPHYDDELDAQSVDEEEEE